MKIYPLEKSKAIHIDKHNSNGFYINRLATLDSKISINFIHLEANGIIGNHKAPVNQIFLIVDGEAIVSSNNHTTVSISKNTAVFFEAGEMHETRTNNGLNAVIIESPDLTDDLFQYNQ